MGNTAFKRRPSAKPRLEKAESEDTDDEDIPTAEPVAAEVDLEQHLPTPLPERLIVPRFNNRTEPNFKLTDPFFLKQQASGLYLTISPYNIRQPSDFDCFFDSQLLTIENELSDPVRQSWIYDTTSHTIRSASQPIYVLQISSRKRTFPGAHLTIGRFCQDPRQKWEIVDEQILALNYKDFCIDTLTPASGAHPIMTKRVGGESQKWIQSPAPISTARPQLNEIIEVEDKHNILKIPGIQNLDFYRLESVATGYNLCISGEKISEGQRIVCSALPTENKDTKLKYYQWIYDPDRKIIISNADHSFVLQFLGAPLPGAPLALKPHTGSAEQHWVLDGHKIRPSMNLNLAVDVLSHANHGNVLLNFDENVSSQMWEPVKV